MFAGRECCCFHDDSSVHFRLCHLQCSVAERDPRYVVESAGRSRSSDLSYSQPNVLHTSHVACMEVALPIDYALAIRVTSSRHCICNLRCCENSMRGKLHLRACFVRSMFSAVIKISVLAQHSESIFPVLEVSMPIGINMSTSSNARIAHVINGCMIPSQRINLSCSPPLFLYSKVNQCPSCSPPLSLYSKVNQCPSCSYFLAM